MYVKPQLQIPTMYRMLKIHKLEKRCATLCNLICKSRHKEMQPLTIKKCYPKSENHKLIFSWLLWLAVLLVGVYARQWRRSCPKWRLYSKQIGWHRHTALVCHVLHWYWTSTLRSTDTCQEKASADQYHMTTLQAQVCNLSRSHFFVKLTTDQVLVFWLYHRLMSG